MNPCALTNDIFENFGRLDSIFHFDLNRLVSTQLNRDDEFGTMAENAELIRTNYSQARELLVNHPQALDHLYYGLQLTDVGEKPEFEDSRFGGIPDLSNFFRLKLRDGKYNTKEIWPRCGCCHEYMQFVAQVDVYPWLVPFHALTGTFRDERRNDLYGLMSSIGNFNMVNHMSIYKSYFLSIFMCKDAGQHWNNPNFDAAIIHSQKSIDLINKLHESKRPEFDMKEFRKSCPVKQTMFDPTKISLNFKINVDYYENYDDVEDIVEENNIFQNGNPTGSDFARMFGVPRSQQEPKRFNTTNSYVPQSQMTPLLSFNHPEDDFTYQIYADLQSSDGFVTYGKVDGSCT